MIVDKVGRSFKYLRVSLTQACNFACQYCVSSSKKTTSNSKELDAQQIYRLIDLINQVNVLKQIRITGGEPLIAPSFNELMKKLAQFKNIEKTLTTNGLLLADKLDLIKQAQVKRINVSIDALEEDLFNKMARSKGLQKVLDGMKMAKNEGFDIKINMVPMKGLNDNQILPMIDFAMENSYQIRFIELMKMGHLYHNNQFNQYFLSRDEILAQVSQKYSLISQGRKATSTTEDFKLEQSGFLFGIISNESKPFCSDCNRLRLTSHGKLYGCLSNSKNHSLLNLLQKEEYKDDKQALIELKKIMSVSILSKQKVKFQGEKIIMKSIGG